MLKYPTIQLFGYPAIQVSKYWMVERLVFETFLIYHLMDNNIVK